MKKKKTWGGKRSGAGAKAKNPEGPKINVSFLLRQPTIEKIERESEENGISRGEVIDEKFK